MQSMTEEQAVEAKVLRRAEISRITRHLKSRLALASFKTKRGWENLGLDSIEPRLAHELGDQQNGNHRPSQTGMTSIPGSAERPMGGIPMSTQVSSHGAESMPPPQLAPPGAYGQREISPKRDFTQAFSAARFHASNQDTSPSRRLPMARVATQGHPSLGSSLASPPPLNGGFAMPTRKRAKTLEGGNNPPPQLHEPHPQSHSLHQQQQQQQRGPVQGRYYPLTASASVPDMKAATSSAAVHTPALEPSHTSDSSTASSASLPARARSRSPPRTPPPRRRGDDSAEASSSQDRDGADLLMYLAASPSPAQKLHGNYAAQSQPNSSPFNPPSVQATPSTPHQGFNFNEYLNLLTPSPARGPNGQGTPQVDRPLLRSARQRLNFDQLPATSGGDSGSSSSSSQATVQANGPSEAPTSLTRDSHSGESTGSASASSGIMASN